MACAKSLLCMVASEYPIKVTEFHLEKNVPVAGAVRRHGIRRPQ